MNVNNLAFYVGKSTNKNVVIYRLNIIDNVIDLFNPIDAYWMMREQPDNPREELTYIEKSMAYGYDILDSDISTDIRIKLKAIDDIVTIRRHNNSYLPFITLQDAFSTSGHKEVILKKVFCNVSGPLGNFVESIEITYQDLDTGKLKKFTRRENKSADIC
jgi:hypothetical protein